MFAGVAEGELLMSMSDPIADMLNRIRNATNIHRKTVDVRGSKVARGIAAALQQEGYIERFEEIADNGQGVLRLFLKYGPDGEMVIQNLRRESKPGCRKYSHIKAVKPVMDGLGITILSTSKGVMSDRQARQQNLGGEVLCIVS
jgi:small subunit ribosomal protein S8